MWLGQSRGEGKPETEAAASAGIIKGFLLCPKSKGEPLRGLKQMKGHYQICHLESVGCSGKTQLGWGG